MMETASRVTGAWVAVFEWAKGPLTDVHPSRGGLETTSQRSGAGGPAALPLPACRERAAQLLGEVPDPDRHIFRAQLCHQRLKRGIELCLAVLRLWSAVCSEAGKGLGLVRSHVVGRLGSYLSSLYYAPKAAKITLRGSGHALAGCGTRCG